MQHFSLVLFLTGLYFAIILGLVVYSRIKETKSFLPGLNEFFLAGKNLHPVILMLTFIGSLFSTFSILGMPGLAYAHGLGGPLFIFLATFFGSILLFFFGKKLRRAAQDGRIFSPIEIISSNFNSRRLGFLIAFIFTIFLIPYISLQLVGIGKFIESYTEGQVGYLMGVGTMMIIVLIYLFLGGMRAVAYTDVVQTVAIFVGLFAGMIFLLNHFDLSIFGLIAETQNNVPDLLTIKGRQGFYDWPIFITSIVMLVGIWFQPHLLTRSMMASKDSDITKIVVGSIIGAVLTTSVAMSYGMFGHYLFGDTVPANNMMGEVFKTLAEINFLGVLLSGLMLMGALGAAMSTADSLLISIGQIATRDMIRPFLKITPNQQIVGSKIIMFLVLLLSFCTGLNPPQFMTDLALYSAAGSTIFIPTILTFSWEKRSLLAAYVSIILGVVSLAILAGYKFQTGDDPLGMHVGFFPMVLSFVSYFVICFIKHKREQHA